MISLSCPHCETEIEVPDSKAGARATCGECGHRLQIPSPTKQITKVATHKPTPKAAPRKTAPPQPKRKQHREDEDLPDKPTTPLALWVGIGAAAACAVGIILFFLLRPTNTASPPVTNTPETGANINPLPFNPPPPMVMNPKPPPLNPPPVEEKKEEKNPGGPANAHEIYQHVLKSTVWVVNIVRNGVGTGTGTLIDKEHRLVLTNTHVVRNSEELVVLFPIYEGDKLVTDKKSYSKAIQNKDIIPAKVLKMDPRRDLALIQLDKLPERAQALPLSGKSVGPGDGVHSLGNPGDSDALWLYTKGTVRQRSHKTWESGSRGERQDHEAEVVETDSATNKGDSGGPLVNDRGELVGVTQGLDPRARLLSIFIDVKEATDFIEKTCQENRLAWNRSTHVLVAGAAVAQVPDLIEGLRNPDAKVRTHSAQALAEMGPGARLAVSALVDALKDPDKLVQRVALDALNRIGAPDKADVARVTQCLKSEDPAVRAYAAETLGKLGADARSAGPSLLEALKDRDAQVRQRAARSLGQVGTDNRQTVFPVLTEALKDPDLQVRLAVAEALVTVSPLQASDLPLLTELLKHQDLPIRAVAVRCVGKLGAAAKPAIPALIEMVQGTQDREVRRAAIEALALFGRDAREAIPALVEALKDEALRPHVIPLLGKMGPDARGAVKALAEALSDGDHATRLSSLAALGKIGPEAKAAVPDLVRLLDNKEREVERAQVLATLLQIGPGAEAAIPALLRVAGEKKQRLFRGEIVSVFDREMHDQAVVVLAKIGKAAVPSLRQALGDQNSLIRLGSVTALGKIGPDARVAARELQVRSQADADTKVREAAATAYREILAKKANEPSKSKN